jgi:peptide-methionine (R)-S-oxide reductase
LQKKSRSAAAAGGGGYIKASLTAPRRHLSRRPAMLTFSAILPERCEELAMDKKAGTRARVVKSDEEWRRQLMPEQYYVTRKHGTEQAFTGPFQDEKRAGTYACVCCGVPLFSSAAKFESGTGWPSFFAPIEAAAVSEHVDRSWFMRHTEIRCATCDAHLGHVFADGPRPSGLRYCMNGTALTFTPSAGVD